MAFKSDRHRSWYFANKKNGTLPSKSSSKGYFFNKRGVPLRDRNNFVTPLSDRYGGVSGPISASEASFFRL